MVTSAEREPEQRRGGLGIAPGVFHVLLCLLHALPIGVVGFIGRSALALLLVPVCAAAMWWASRMFDLTVRVPGFLLSAYAYGATGFWMAFGGFLEYPFSRTLFCLHFLFVTAAWLASRAPWAQTWVPRFVAMLFVGFFSGIATLPFARFGGIISIAVLTILLWREREACRRAWSRLGAPALLPAVSAFFAFLFSFALQGAPRPDLADQVTRQEGVVALALAGPLEMTQPRMPVVAESCRSADLIVGLAPIVFPPRLTLIRRAHQTGEITLGSEVKHPSANAAMDCTRGVLYVGRGDPPAVLAFRDDNLKEPRDTILLSGGRPSFLSLAEDGSRLTALDGMGHIHVLDLSTHQELPEAEDRSRPCSLQAEVRWLPSSFLGPAPACTYDPQTRSVWTADFERGVLRRNESPGGQVRDSLRLERGIRTVLLDPVSRVLAVGNYLTGHVSLIQADTASILRTYWIGPRIDAMTFSSDRERLYATSLAGLFEIPLRDTRGD